MNRTESNARNSVKTVKPRRLLPGPAALLAVLLLAGCGMPWQKWHSLDNERRSEHFERSEVLVAQGKYEAAFKENQKAFAEGKGAPDLALFNMGLISAHSLNPKKDYPRALLSFKKLIQEHPHSALAEQAKAWVHVLEEHRKVAEERHRLAEEKRTLTREREVLLQERERLKYTAEKSRQVDIEIEKRRRRTLAK